MALRFLAHLCVALARVTWRRARGKRLRPTWSFRFEVVVELMRVHSKWLATLEPSATRRAAERMTRPLPPGVSLRDEALDGIPCSWFLPPDARQGTLLFVHGGAFVFGSPRQAKGTIGELALRTRRRAVAPSYRRAPEHPCPAALKDVSHAYRALLDRGVAPDSISVVGESAGAGILLGMLQSLRDAGTPLPASVVLLSPAINLCADSPSWSDHRGIDYGDPSYILAWNRQYAGSLALDDPRVSPLNGNVAGLPRLLVVAGAAELLVDDARALVAKARAAGVTSELVLGQDMVHAYASFGTLTPCAEAALRAITDFMAPPRPGAPPDPHQ